MKSIVITIVEKVAPILIACVSTIVIRNLHISFLCHPNLIDIVNISITAASILIGLIGAVIPTLITSQSSSEIIRIVIHYGGNLLVRYATVSVSIGLLFILISMVALFHSDYCETWLYNNIFNLWFFLGIYFLTSTARFLYFAIFIMIKPPSKINGLYHKGKKAPS